ncbi:MAG: maltose alpha-D-glucosyltransferase [Thermoanaerobaculia bacterium]
MPPRRKPPTIEDDPLWYKDGIIYQLHVRAFSDSNADGIGDFAGLTSKLDYLSDLGVTTLWLLPFYPSPLRDDGYDIASYTGIHATYGTMSDFRAFLREAHERGMRVITELVINHTSDQHPWFQRSRTAKPGSRWRDFYVWTDNPKKYKEARIIFKDFEKSNWTWDPVAKAYYWHRFYHHQPDLNFDNPAVRSAILQLLDSWLEMGVDGLRLDAVPYLFEREGTSCENLPETHAFLKELRAHMDSKFRNRMLLAEANQWPEDAAVYFGNGDECHLNFHFPLMPRLFMSVAMEDRFPIIDILQQTPEIPENCQWAVFLRNHDELTLEMVTDEDRDYMYRAYARDVRARINLGIRRRLAPLMGNHRRRIELMNALLFSFPGTPIIYYGDEIGMGDNIYLGDRNGVRTPMQWSPDRNAGFSRANPQKLFLPIIIDPEYHYETVNVEAQQNNAYSLLWWTKRLIDLRKRTKAFGRGSIEFLHPDNRKVLAFVRRYESETILVVANLSRFVQATEIDLASFRGMVPVEMFGRTAFPEIGESPYFLTLSQHSFYWFSLEKRRSAVVEVPGVPNVPVLHGSSWEDLIASGKPFDVALAQYLRSRRWFGGKAREIKNVRVEDVVPVDPSRTAITFVRVEYIEGLAELYVVPLGVEWGESDKLQNVYKGSAVAWIEGGEMPGVLYEAVNDRAFQRALLQAIGARRQFRGESSEIQGLRTRLARPILTLDEHKLEPSLVKTEQSNSSIVYGDKYFMKLFRRVEDGENVDLEVSRFLTEKTGFKNVPAVAGALEYRLESGETMTLAMLQQYVPNGGDAWSFTLDALGRFFERVLSRPTDDPLPKAPPDPLVKLAYGQIPEVAASILDNYLEEAELLGQRTGELHLALASRPDDPAFAPEPFTPFYQRSIYQAMRSQTSASLHLLRRKLKELPEPLRPQAEAVIRHEHEIQRRFRALLDRTISAMRIRVHGDYHLGQVLYTGRDFVIIDFEGEPARPMSERRIKRSALRDVAGMLRSFHYAPHAILLGAAPGVAVRSGDVAALDRAATFWQTWVSAAFLRAYIAASAPGAFVPSSPEEFGLLLDVYLLEKSLYELAYELNNRPEWVGIPLRGILQLIEPR